MSYLEEWNEIKRAFARENDEVIAALKRYKAELKEEKKSDRPNRITIDNLEELIRKSTVVKKTKTGMSQVLPAYDAVLPLAEALAENWVLPSDPAWKPVQKALIKVQAANLKANKAVREMCLKAIEEEVTPDERVPRGQMPDQVRKRYIDKGKAARRLLDDLKELQAKISARMSAIVARRGEMERIIVPPKAE
jgi:hypothetical protein